MSSWLQSVKTPLETWLFGLDDAIEAISIALLCGGHVLLEGPPGTAKTLMVNLMAQLFDVPFNRVQFTPDLMPADIIGTMIFNQQKAEFSFKPGALFTTFLLADEINRAPAKTQSALLEAMQERQVTVDGTHHPLSALFTVFATQNPLDHEGTYPLPEAQLDRFLFKVLIPYPSPSAEAAMLRRHHGQSGHQAITLSPVMTEQNLLALQAQADNMVVQDPILDYILSLVTQTREHASIAVGCSPRAAILWTKAAKSQALIEGRDYVIPDDIKKTAKPLLRHRLILFPQAELEGKRMDDIIDDLLLTVKPPR